MQTGAVLRDRYRIDALAGAGGMGTVYRATDSVTGTTCAIKFLAEGASEHTRDRFVREADILAKVSHPAIVAYLDHGSDPPFLVMEWVDGETLADRLRTRGATPAEALRLTARLVRGLSAVHEAGVVHRDLKPRNIMLPNGAFEDAKIVDFGIARVHTLDGTRTGIRLGTPRYMAPEQIVSARRVDGRADIFSLGCVLFEALAGRKAFRGNDEIALLARMVIEDAPRMRSVRNDLPTAVDDLVALLLARDFKRRPRASDTLAKEILALANIVSDLPSRVSTLDADRITLDQTPTDFAISTELTPLPEPSELPWATVGRESECEALIAMLTPGAIVSLWGSLGIGKSHLAQDVARRCWSSRGAIVCDLRNTTNETDMLRRIGGELGALHAITREDVAVAVSGRGDLLLVLDACDAVNHAGFALAQEIITEAPRASVLLVSRERQNISNAMELGPLDPNASIALIVARSHGALDELRDHRAIAAIAEHLQHNPLFLTLAASRASVLGAAAIASRLDRPLDVLGSAKTPSYPTSLREALESVWETLSSNERCVIACAAEFPQNVRPAIVETMANVMLGENSIEALETLLAKSLLRPATRGTFVMDPALRELARAKLVIADRSHMTFAREVIARASVDVERARDNHGEALADLFAFEADLIAAFEIAIEHQDADLVLAAALGLEPSLVARGPLDRLASILDRATNACDSLRAVTPAPLARLIAAHGRALSLCGSFDHATIAFEGALTLAQDPDLAASIWLDFGVMYQARGDLDGAERCYVMVLDDHGGGASRAEARAQGNLGALAHDRGDLDRAYGHYVRAVAVAESIDDLRLLGVFLGNLAVLDRERGLASVARQRFVRALHALEEAKQRRLIGITLGNLGMLELEQERHDAARAAFDRSADLLASLGDAHSEALAQARLAAVIAIGGSATRAEEALARAERLSSSDSRTLAVVKFFRVFPDAARAMAGGESSRVFAERVRDRIASSRALLASDDDARGALRILERWAKSVTESGTDVV